MMVGTHPVRSPAVCGIVKNKMKIGIRFTVLAVAITVFIAGCKKDDFVADDGVCPIVVTTSPVQGETNVALGKIITATFNEKMNPTTITQASVTLRGSAAVSGTVSYTGQTASFAPNGGLASNSTYIAKITTAVKDENGIAMRADYEWTFSTGATLSPLVVSTDPTDNALNVVRNKIVRAKFNMPMDPLTLNASTFLLRHGTTAVTGAVTFADSIAYFSPSANLLSDSTYTATITTGAKNLAGVAIPNNYVWTFTVGTITAPTVISTDPLDQATGVAQNKVLAATFSEPMNATTLNGTTMLLKQGANTVAGTVTQTSTTVSFAPSSNLLPGLVYTATITTGVQNLAGVPMANDYVWTFTTLGATAPMVISTDPTHLASNVPRNQVISATFSEPMNAATLNSSTMVLMNGANVVPGTVNYAGNTATFTPTALLLSSTTYTVTITTGATSMNGINMANNYVWTFTTIAHLGPQTVDLGTVQRFGMIAGTGVSNMAGFSEIHDMDVGISPGVRSSIVGFPPAIVVNGAIYASDDISPPGVAAMLIQAKQDLTDAYLFAEGANNPAPILVSGDIGGQTLAPGIYKTNSTLMVQSGDLTLDAQGDANAVWIFQVASGFTTVGGAGGSVILSGGAQAKNVFWQTGSSATVGDYTSFKGNILALTSITMNSHATAEGRMLARNGAVVMTSTNMIIKP
jgi:hypothetical protein